MKRMKGWGAVAALSVASNITFLAVANKFPNGPFGRLKALIVNNQATSSTTTRTGS